MSETKKRKSDTPLTIADSLGKRNVTRKEALRAIQVEEIMDNFDVSEEEIQGMLEMRSRSQDRSLSRGIRGSGFLWEELQEKYNVNRIGDINSGKNSDGALFPDLIT